ncbi:MAG: nucleotidyl transferase AbiEii/AbiGii toxin family protein [candidate division WOR-3 bacterium]|nr:nucleotidyl transferase AbiEii/AbiGii toxin family protein [candidate division WOR-3 bacterium]
MLNLIEKEISSIPDRETKIHITREFLQLLILKILYDRGYYKNLAFVGGTALRFLYGLRRFSEDLDFSLIGRQSYDFDKLLKQIVYDLEKSGLSLDVKERLEAPVQSAMLKFKNTLFQLGLSNLKSEKLSIKLEIDANPPKGWNTAIGLISKHFVFTVTTFDISSLYALKLHACFYRKYTKGRDFYDLLWYLGRKEMPNFKLLNNAIMQTEGKKGSVTAENFVSFLKNKLVKIDFVKARKDVARFIEDKNELKLINKDTILKLLS